ncbi:DNA repair protein RecO [Sanyastnella coralliicola]|uniref:DNA repair protein RecO n=1 Tax=Sanyastnella coralliicola TaxID=3069118 RepID=UPI0027B96CE3|nr:recombination protein O N-terminal domain-containing protein [Longitalea sp. SCSIO 12813]
MRIFTESNGLRAYLVRGVGKKRSSSNALLQPLSLVEITERERSRGSLYQIAEHKRAVVLTHMSIEPYKGMLAMFMAELVQHCIAEDHAHPELFDYLWNTTQMMDIDDQPGVYAILLAGRLMKFLGVMPDEMPLGFKQEEGFLDLASGHWSYRAPLHNAVIEGQLGSYLRNSCAESPEAFRRYSLTRNDLRSLLDAQVKYLQLHINDQRELKSLEVLREVFA